MGGRHLQPWRTGGIPRRSTACHSARTTAFPLTARIVTGSLSAATVGVAGGGSAWLAAVMGAIGALVGALGGYRARVGLVRALHVPDLAIAIPEDLVAIGLGFLVVTRF